MNLLYLCSGAFVIWMLVDAIRRECSRWFHNPVSAAERDALFLPRLSQRALGGDAQFELPEP